MDKLHRYYNQLGSRHFVAMEYFNDFYHTSCMKGVNIASYTLGLKTRQCLGVGYRGKLENYYKYTITVTRRCTR